MDAQQITNLKAVNNTLAEQLMLLIYNKKFLTCLINKKFNGMMATSKETKITDQLHGRNINASEDATSRNLGTWTDIATHTVSNVELEKTVGHAE